MQVLHLTLSIFFVSLTLAAERGNISDDLWPLVTPLLGVSNSCLIASKEYVRGLESREHWALKMLESSGTLPFLQEGLLSDVQEVTVDLCRLLAGILPEAGCPDFLSTFSISLPHGHGVGLGSEKNCAEVEHLPTQYCHQVLLPSQSQEFVKESWKPRLAATEVDSLFTGRGQHLHILNDSPLFTQHQGGFDHPGNNRFLRKVQRDVNDAIFSSCPSCKAVSTGHLLMLWGLLWMSVNMQSGGGSFVQFPAHRTCFPAQCSREDINNNNLLLAEKYGLKINGSNIFLVSSLALPEEFLNGEPDPLPGCTNSEDKKSENHILTPIFALLAFFLLCGTAFDIFWRTHPKTDAFSSLKRYPIGIFIATEYRVHSFHQESWIRQA